MMAQHHHVILGESIKARWLTPKRVDPYVWNSAMVEKALEMTLVEGMVNGRDGFPEFHHRNAQRLDQAIQRALDMPEARISETEVKIDPLPVKDWQMWKYRWRPKSEWCEVEVHEDGEFYRVTTTREVDRGWPIRVWHGIEDREVPYWWAGWNQASRRWVYTRDGSYASIEEQRDQRINPWCYCGHRKLPGHDRLPVVLPACVGDNFMTKCDCLGYYPEDEET